LRNTDFENWKTSCSLTVLWKNTVIRVPKTLWGEVCEAVVSEWSQLDGPEKHEKGKHCCFSIYLIQMHRVTLICFKVQRCLTLQRKLNLAESYDFLVVVNKGQYFSQYVRFQIILYRTAKAQLRVVT
jgi:hypothetical protein